MCSKGPKCRVHQAERFALCGCNMPGLQIGRKGKGAEPEQQQQGRCKTCAEPAPRATRLPKQRSDKQSRACQRCMPEPHVALFPQTKETP